ncbi:hypothetical protein [Pseudodesulfovibrio senegalensis]|jgi:hypothetical protein|uniref:Uncharacterized protein n=1 Tax=Pseudodesulfovibrio senegalensis TaxID=1721087 RepID=A0A6N6MZR2_9BACT|nr:hypothetical protein [Pseudodesulfovibrio senegalensis]KAB1439103.1 hypothetical protein F8A88_14450 [Pseudodesulfovibrio senegalensis]
MSGYHPDGILDNLIFGLKVWLDEIRWMGKTSLRRFEIGRLEKQLEEEYVHLGRIAEAPRGRKEEKERTLGQIKFLKEEINTLQEELEQGDKERKAARKGAE